MSESLYVIEDSLRQLAELRDAAELEGDSEALKVIDQQIADYLARVGTKVSSYVTLIRSRSAIVDACEAELDRIERIQRSAQAVVDRLKSTALVVMQRFGVTLLRDERTGHGLRRQANGGLRRIEITSYDDLPDEYTPVTVRLSPQTWAKMPKEIAEKCVVVQVTIDTEPIRKALGERVRCPECAGNPPTSECPRCKGAGNIPNTIPGAKLLERGEHVRVI
jgi:Siphovirus Gp157